MATRILAIAVLLSLSALAYSKEVNESPRVHYTFMNPQKMDTKSDLAAQKNQSGKTDAVNNAQPAKPDARKKQRILRSPK